MDADGKGYIHDVDYVPGFYGNMAPIAMRYIAALNRVTPPPNTPSFRYLELGAGLGRCLTTLAAACPHGHFVGVDFNKNHTAVIEQDVAAGKLSNVEVITAGFNDLPETLGEFDYIALHGVYSWVSREVQEAILTIARRHLARHGTLLVSYNAMPGWASLQPIRAIIQQYATRRSGDSLKQIAEALKYLKYIRDNKAQYFQDNPLVAEKLDVFMQQDQRYLAHEYLNTHWDTLYFHEVAADFKTAGLDFIGSLPAYTNFWDLCVRPEFKDLFATTTDRDVIETHKDFCANTAFRWDIYCREPRGMPSLEERLAHADDFYFRLSKQEIELPLIVNIGIVTTKAHGPVYEKLVVLLKEKGMRLSEILASGEWGDITPEEIVSAIDVGVCIGVFEVEAQSVDMRKKLSKTARIGVPSAFNRHMLASNLLAGRTLSLSSERTGNGYLISEINAVILYELVERGYDGLADRVLERIKQAGRGIKQKGVDVTDADEQKAVTQRLCDTFFNSHFNTIVALGIAEEAV